MRLCCSLSPPPPQGGTLEPEETATERQRLGKHFPLAKNTHTTLEELLYAVFSIRSMSYQIIDMLVKGKQAIISSQNFLFVKQ
jgi:hypothetical protein